MLPPREPLSDRFMGNIAVETESMEQNDSANAVELGALLFRCKIERNWSVFFRW